MPYLGKDVQAFFAKQNNILPLKAPISLIFRFVRHGCNEITIQTLKGPGLRHKKLGLPFYRGGVGVTLKRGNDCPEQGGRCF